jgi:hypothetical protein
MGFCVLANILWWSGISNGARLYRFAACLDDRTSHAMSYFTAARQMGAETPR